MRSIAIRKELSDEWKNRGKKVVSKEYYLPESKKKRINKKDDE